MTIGPPVPKIQFDLENSRSKVKVKGQGQKLASPVTPSDLITSPKIYRVQFLPMQELQEQFTYTTD